MHSVWRGPRALASLAVAAGLFSLAGPSAAAAAPPSVAATPPMGWNSWNHFAAKIDDATVRAQADAMVSSGMRDAGYRYINIDDTWEGTRDAAGVIHSNAKFPDMKALADYVHAKGLKLGIYSSPGPKTCAGYEGSEGHEAQDAKTYADWGIDYLKYDLCSLGDRMKATGSLDKAQDIELVAYRKMDAAISATGRPMVYSLCQYGVAQVWRWGGSVGGNLWRTTGDITDRFSRMTQIGFGQAGLAKYAKPGQWNDPDMLEVGNGGMSPIEYRTHMSLWALLAAPLLAGNDLSKMTPDTLAILTNREVIAIDQDKAGRQGDRVHAEGPLEVWAKPLAGGGKAVGLFNLSDQPSYVEVSYADLGLKAPVKTRDVWAAKDLGKLTSYRALVVGHGVVVLRLG
ncbi:glycoside hydrolase family 27 protein [Phenylobacterium sp.]|uniref:glycoside hydrolase family 27 protein n=1 Tax=Phenylobacterium sp. TaxID=1871053 RepID=UPI0012045541|nr:glycoside hydrolase family 27 protein [Phenylobacterium sp.]THD70976.1 MAG: glycoside hydrolase family 27 protein [Phenylobacterium sp.]